MKWSSARHAQSGQSRLRLTQEKRMEEAFSSRNMDDEQLDVVVFKYLEKKGYEVRAPMPYTLAI